jgi:hypothetical protein
VTFELVDTFLYAGEGDLLEIRLVELAGLCTRHIAIVGDRTFQGGPLEVDAERCFALASSSPLTIVRVPLTAEAPMGKEAQLRNWLEDWSRAFPADLYLHGDVDEIPRRADLKAAVASYERPVRLRGDTHQHRLNWRVTPTDADWPTHPFQGPVLASAEHTRAAGGTLALRKDTTLPERRHSGWHLQWVMSAADCVRKVKSFAHPELDRDPFTNPAFWDDCATEGLDPMNRWPLELVEIDNTFPLAVRQDPQRWRHLMREPANPKGTES